MQSVPTGAGGAIPRPFLFALAVLVSACVVLGVATARAGRSPVDDDPPATVGRASYYGPGFAGRRTASGSVFRPEQLTAAHRSLPLGTKVRVTNLHNGRSVLVTITDRGPFTRGRHIDLSVAAARVIGMLGRGVANVRIEVV
jgi:rare lipoprotein A (peptidoglycan hydrolase)